MGKFKLYILNNKKIFFISSILFIIICIVGYYFYNNSYDNEQVVVDLFDNVDDETNLSNTNEEIIEIPEVIEYIYVDIKGYVNKPGVYKIEKASDMRIYDLIKLAGGLKKDADTSIVNMSLKLKDEMVVIIYSKKHIQDFVKTKEEITNKIEICDKEDIKNDGCICEGDIDNNVNDDNSNDNNVNSSEKININTANKDILMTITGIGESKAIAIIDYRNEYGQFEKIEDIKNVSGIGDSVFEKIKDIITVK